MAERLDAAPLGEPGPLLGRGVALLRGGDIHERFPVPAREQAPGGPVLAPVGPQLRQQAGREERVAILGPLPLLHPQTPPRGIEVMELEPDHLAHPQPGAVGGGQERPLLAGSRGLQQVPHLAGAQALGEPLRLLRAGDREGRRAATQGRVVEEAEGVHRDTTRAPGQLLVPEHVDEVGLDLLGRELIGRAAVVPGQADHGGPVGLPRPLRHPPDQHGVVHAHAQLGPDAPPVSG